MTHVEYRNERLIDVTRSQRDEHTAWQASTQHTRTTLSAHTLTPRRNRTRTPRRKRTRTPRRERTLTPRRERTLTPRRERTLTPRRERTLTSRLQRTAIAPLPAPAYHTLQHTHNTHPTTKYNYLPTTTHVPTHHPQSLRQPT